MNNRQHMSLDINNLVCFSFYAGWREIAAIYKDVLGKDITPQQVYVLESCDLNNKITMQELSRKIDLDSSAVSTLVSRMERNALLQRTHGIEDRRTVFVQLTKEGYELRERIRLRYDELIARVNKGLSDNEVSDLVRMVNKIKNR